MRRVCVSIVTLTLLLTAGCAGSPAASNASLPTSTTATAKAVQPPTTEAASSTTTVPGNDSGALPASRTTTWSAGETSSDPTFQGVVLGPGNDPVASADIAPRIFRDSPAAIKEVLEQGLPAYVAAEKGQYSLGSHLVLGLRVAGAAETKTGVEVYADVWEQWFWLDGWKPVQGTTGAFPARIRLTRDGDAFILAGMDRPKDGDDYIPSINAMLPAWVRKRVDDDEVRARLEEAVLLTAADWARPNVPADLFVEQAPATIPDPHGHQPALSRYRMLAAHYVDCTIPEISVPAFDSYQPQYAMLSADKRFSLHFLLDGKGAVVEDTRTGKWRSIVAPGQPQSWVSSTTFDPICVGHTLFIDFSTYLDAFTPTLTHYEIDFDTATVVRAVPMGPLSFNEPAK
jgi:hypothetical protein